MPHIRVCTVIDAPPPRVWQAVERIERHVDWMADALSIEFDGEQRAGAGTSFTCRTRVGPFRTADRMTVVEWEEPTAMGIHHTGAVTGTGRFTLTGARGGRTRFCWDERLAFPWWLGGPLGGVVGRPVLRSVWRRNLARLKHQVEGAS